MNVVAMWVNSSACSSATGATMPRCVAELGEEAAEARRRLDQHLGDGLEVDQQRPQVLDRLVEREAAAGEGVAVAGEVGAGVLTRRGVEGVGDVVELGLLLEAAVGRRSDASGSAAASSSAGRVQRPPSSVPLNCVALRARVAGAADDLEVLEAERRAVADAEDRVLGKRLGVLVELEVDLGGDPAGVVGGVGRRRPRRCERSSARSRSGPARSTRRRRRGGRRSGPRCCWSGARRSGPRPRPGRPARTAGRCSRCRRGTRRRSRSAP